MIRDKNRVVMLGSTRTFVYSFEILPNAQQVFMAPVALASPVYHQHIMRMGLARNQARNHNETTTKTQRNH